MFCIENTTYSSHLKIIRCFLCVEYLGYSLRGRFFMLAGLFECNVVFGGDGVVFLKGYVLEIKNGVLMLVPWDFGKNHGIGGWFCVFIGTERKIANCLLLMTKKHTKGKFRHLATSKIITRNAF